MKVHRNFDELPDFKNTIISIGSFDGIHLGHQKIIELVKKIAWASDGESVIITFHPHPRQIIYPKDQSLELLSTLDEKISLIQKMDIDHLVIVPFTVEFSQVPPREYVEGFLIKKFDPTHLIIGYDHRFGHNRQGDIYLLREFENRGFFQITEIPKQEIDELAISSTKIRNALKDGDMDKASRFLGRPYILSGKVVHGKKLGKALGYPTANLHIPESNKLVPAAGIYAVQVELEEELLDGMMYIGTNPTVDDRDEESIEIHIFDFSSNIYGQYMKVYIHSYLREDLKFDNVNTLAWQIRQDELRAKEILYGIRSLANRADPVAIAILNYNGLDFLESFLPLMLESSNEDFTIYLIDNASTDESLEYIKEWHPEIKIISLDRNYGFAGGYNKGLQQIKARYYVILNSDIKVEDNWLDPLIQMMESDDQIACIQPKILSLDNPKEFEYAGAAGGYMDLFFYPFCRGRIFDSLEEDDGQYNSVEDVFWISGAAMIIRADVFHGVGGFDPDFFAHQEEIDLCWRIKKAGYKIVCCPDSRVYHFGGGTLSYEDPYKTYLNFRNNHMCYLKNAGAGSLIWKVPVRWFLDAMAFVKFILDGKFLNALAIPRAYFYLLTHFPAIVRKRKFVRAMSDNIRIGPPNRSGMTRVFAVWEYFVRRKKSFDQIVSQ